MSLNFNLSSLNDAQQVYFIEELDQTDRQNLMECMEQGTLRIKAADEKLKNIFTKIQQAKKETNKELGLLSSMKRGLEDLVGRIASLFGHRFHSVNKVKSVAENYIREQQLSPAISIQTANMSSTIVDPFEFEGDYGADANETRRKVFEAVLSPATLWNNLSNSETKDRMENAAQASEEEIKNFRKTKVAEEAQREKGYGPTLGELVTSDLLQAIKNKQEEMGFQDKEFEKITLFVDKYKDTKIFHFLRNSPSALLGLDKGLRDDATNNGKPFNFSLLGSLTPLEGETSLDLKSNLIDELFKKDVFQLAKPLGGADEIAKKSRISEKELTERLDKGASLQDLEAFASPLILKTL